MGITNTVTTILSPGLFSLTREKGLGTRMHGDFQEVAAVKYWAWKFDYVKAFFHVKGLGSTDGNFPGVPRANIQTKGALLW